MAWFDYLPLAVALVVVWRTIRLERMLGAHAKDDLEALSAIEKALGRLKDGDR